VEVLVPRTRADLVDRLAPASIVATVDQQLRAARGKLAG
jgi:hypothetical protein